MKINVSDQENLKIKNPQFKDEIRALQSTSLTQIIENKTSDITNVMKLFNKLSAKIAISYR